MKADHNTIERLARRLCHESGGDWERRYTKRAHWMAKARRLVERERGIATADALMGIFGYRRAG